MTAYRGLTPFLIVGATLGIISIEYLQSEQEWGRAIERLIFLWAGIATVTVPALLERLAAQRGTKRKGSKRKRKSRSSATEPESVED